MICFIPIFMKRIITPWQYWEFFGLWFSWVWCNNDDDEKKMKMKMKMIPDIFLRWLMTQGIEFLFQQLAQILMVPARLEHWNKALIFTSENLFTDQICLPYIYPFWVSEIRDSPHLYHSMSIPFYQVVLHLKLILIIVIGRGKDRKRAQVP